MKESKFRSKIVELLSSVYAFPVENSVDVGQPDVCCVPGWIELKIAERPVRASSIVQIDMRASQRLWHTNWRFRGGRSWTLTLLDKTWMLHDGYWSSKHLGRSMELDLRQAVVAVWDSEPSALDLINALVRPLPRIK